MKTHELARNLERLAKWLRQLPDAELDDSLPEITQSLLPGIAPVLKREIVRTPRSSLRGVERRLATMPLAEIEKFLSAEEEGFTAAYLTEIAKRLGITTASRQNKSALINLIVRHFEAVQMHAIMRSTGPEEG